MNIRILHYGCWAHIQYFLLDVMHPETDKKIPGQTDEQLPGIPYLAVLILM